MLICRDNSQLFASSVDWNINQESFLPSTTNPQKLVRAWERVPVVAHAARLKGNTVWKKPAPRDNGRSHEIEVEVSRESKADGETARKRLRLLQHRSSTLEAQWAEIPPVDARDSLIPAIAESAGIQETLPEDRATFPPLHFVPRKRTYTNEVIAPPHEAEQGPKELLTSKAKMLLTTDVATGNQEKPARRRKSARKSMADMKITLGAPDLGLQSPRWAAINHSPSKGTSARASPMKVFKSTGGGCADLKMLDRGANIFAKGSRRTTVAAISVLPAFSNSPVGQSSDPSIGRHRSSLAGLPIDTQALSNFAKVFTASKNGSTPSTAKLATSSNEADEGSLGFCLSVPRMNAGSPKRKRSLSPMVTKRRSSRLSIFTGTPSEHGADLPTLVKDVPTTTSPLKVDEESRDDTTKPHLSRPGPAQQMSASGSWTEAPDLFGTSPSYLKTAFDSVTPVKSILRSPAKPLDLDLREESEVLTSKVHVLVSIKSMHMTNIHCGLKTHEFRAYKLPEETRYLWIYETAPKQCLTHVANIGPAKSPGQIGSIGLGNAEFNSESEKIHYAYEILRLYELKKELPLKSLLDKQYARAPPQKYSFATIKMLNEVSLFEHTNLVFDNTSRHLKTPSRRFSSLPIFTTPEKSDALFSSSVQKTQRVSSAIIQHAGNSDKLLSPAQLDSIQEADVRDEAVAPKEDLESSGDLSPPKYSPSKFLSLSPAFKDLLASHKPDDESSLLLSSVKGSGNKRSKLSPIQLGNILMQELDGEDSDVFPISPLTRTPVANAAEITRDSIRAASTLSPHDDAPMLEDFLTRVKANRAAAKKQEQVEASPEKPVSRSPIRRRPLAKAITNHSSSLHKPPSRFGSKRKAPVEPPSPKSEQAKGESTSVAAEKPTAARRSTRIRTPTKGCGNPSPRPISTFIPSSVPILTPKCPEGVSESDFAIQQRADAKLAAVTRLNTDRNEGPHTVQEYLVTQATDAARRRAAERLRPKAKPAAKSTKSTTGGAKKTASFAVPPVDEVCGSGNGPEEPCADDPEAPRKKSVKWAKNLVQYDDGVEPAKKVTKAPAKKAVKVSVASSRAPATPTVATPRRPVRLTSRTGLNATPATPVTPVRSAATVTKVAIGMGITGPGAAEILPDLTPSPAKAVRPARAAAAATRTPTAIPVAAASTLGRATYGTPAAGVTRGLAAGMSRAKKVPAVAGGDGAVKGVGVAKSVGVGGAAKTLQRAKPTGLAGAAAGRGSVSGAGSSSGLGLSSSAGAGGGRGETSGEAASGRGRGRGVAGSGSGTTAPPRSLRGRSAGRGKEKEKE